MPDLTSLLSFLGSGPKTEPSDYTSPTQRIVDAIASFAGPDPHLLDALAKYAVRKLSKPDPEVSDWTSHPEGAREGSVESLIKLAGQKSGSLIPADLPYLEQYLHPDKDVLPPTDKRPTALRPYSDVPYREPSHLGDGMVNRTGLGHFQQEWQRPVADSRFPNAGSPFTAPAVHDLWDFETTAKLGPPGINQALKLALQSAGKPFAVYGVDKLK